MAKNCTRQIEEQRSQVREIGHFCVHEVEFSLQVGLERWLNLAVGLESSIGYLKKRVSSQFLSVASTFVNENQST